MLVKRTKTTRQSLIGKMSQVTRKWHPTTLWLAASRLRRVMRLLRKKRKKSRPNPLAPRKSRISKTSFCSSTGRSPQSIERTNVSYSAMVLQTLC